MVIAVPPFASINVSEQFLLRLTGVN